MSTSERQLRPVAIAFNAVLVLVFAAGLAYTAHMITDSWGASYWQFDCAMGVVVCLLALGRAFERRWTAIAGLVVAFAAIVIAAVADLPHEPGPITSLALAVLVGSAVRHLPLPSAAGIAAGGLAVVVACWVAGGFRGVASVVTVTWLAAVTVGAILRSMDQGRRTSTRSTVS